MLIEIKLKLLHFNQEKKKHESLTTYEDASLILEYKDYFKILPDYKKYKKGLSKNKNKKLSENFCYSSDKNTNFLNKEDLKTLLVSIDIEK